MLIAEESTAWPGVTRPADEGGLGFHYKWNMGWMHDTLHYMHEEPVYRRWHHGEITFGLVYAFSERFMLPLSHDEVVYGKGSLIRKMPGDEWQKFANLRAYFGFMWTYPGKKLLFMGGEFAQDREWNHDIGLDWFLLDDRKHAGRAGADPRPEPCSIARCPRCTRAIATAAGFRWVVVDDADNSVFAYLRQSLSGAPPALVVCNFTPAAAPRLPARRAACGALGGAAEYRRRGLWRLQRGQWRRGRGARTPAARHSPPRSPSPCRRSRPWS